MSNNYPIFAGHQRIERPYAFTLEQVEKLCRMQDTLNSYIYPEWKTQRFNWVLAIQDEIMEIHGHLGWKWWKGDYLVGLTQENLRQVQLEVIDILHFFVSQWLAEGLEKYLQENLNDENDSYTIGYRLGLLMHCSSDSLGVHWTGLAKAVGLTEQMILETYTQKYVLNKFRQDNGYKTGEYVKVWTHELNDGFGNSYMASREDNEVLADIVAARNLASLDSADEQALYTLLGEWYNSRLNK